MDIGVNRVLLVEDDADSAEASEVLFRYWGYDVMVARRADEGLAMALSRHPDAIVLDLGLPTFDDGCAFVRALRAQCGALTLLVAVTGHGREIDRRRAVEAGCDYFFAKPADLDELKDALSGAPTHVRKGPHVVRQASFKKAAES